ncbi:MAG TPA: tRNA pseudouridine(13) synthase TruD [Thermoplasmata archaeon]
MDETDLGLELYFTQGIPGIGGKLRKRPEDFVVEENSLPPAADPAGKFVIATVWHRNWEANRLVRRLGSNLRVGRNKIGFAGTKDGRSVATQLMSFDAPIEAVTALEIPDVKILDAYRARRTVELGDLLGNRFEITISDIVTDVGAVPTCERIREALDSAGGFPNFFGTQRFGSVRPITHLIGKDLVAGDVEGAVMRYVACPLEEDSEINEARKRLQESFDFKAALREFPKKLTFERMMIEHLNEHPEDYIGALRRLPRNLLMMFVHAYQSYLFNRTLSERIRRGLSIREPVIGDLMLPLDKNGLPDHDNPISVEKGNLEKATRNARQGKGFVSGLLYGTESVFAEGPMGEIERHIVEAEGISKLDFQIVGLREASSKGTRRELLAPYRGLTIDVQQDRATFCFSLNKGCYATALLREFMKAPMSQY